MLWRVSRGRQGPQREPGEVHLVAIAQPAVRELQAPGGGRDHLGAPRGQLAAAGHKIGMQVRLGRIRDDQAQALGGGQVGGRIALGVDHQRPAVTQVKKIRGVSEALVDQSDGPGICGHRLSLSWPPGAG